MVILSVFSTKRRVQKLHAGAKGAEVRWKNQLIFMHLYNCLVDG